MFEVAGDRELDPADQGQHHAVERDVGQRHHGRAAHRAAGTQERGLVGQAHEDPTGLEQLDLAAELADIGHALGSQRLELGGGQLHERS